MNGMHTARGLPAGTGSSARTAASHAARRWATGLLSGAVSLVLASPLALARPPQSTDPANVDAGASSDAAMVSVRPAFQKPAQKAPARRSWEDLTQIPAEKYRQAYGSDAARARLGHPRRPHAAGAETSTGWLSGEASGPDAQALMRQLEPAVRKLKRDVDSGLLTSGGHR